MTQPCTFNLVDEAWIRARALDGDVKELSIRQVFSDASQYRSLSNELPTQDFAILRVLLAILQRSLNDEMTDDKPPSDMWGKLWDDDSLPMECINRYLDEWHDRFDLFDREKPFMQSPGLHSSKDDVDGVAKIIADVPDGNPFFVLRNEDSLKSLSCAEAARWLIHVQAFDTSGIKTGMVGDPTVKGGKSYPIGTGWAGKIGGLFFEGDSLRETLLLNLVLSGESNAEPFSPDDLPTWERGDYDLSEGERQPTGRMDLYTWQSRRVLLKCEGGSVTGVLLTNGDKISPQNRRTAEPMTGWRESKNQAKKLGIAQVFMPVQHRANRAFWRGNGSLFPLSDAREQEGEQYLRPGIVSWLVHLSSPNGGRRLQPNRFVSLHAVGAEYGTQSAVITQIINDHLTFKASLLSEEGYPLSVLARECVGITDKAVDQLAWLASNIYLASGGDAEQTSGPRDSARAEAYFELDNAFRSWFERLDASSDAAQVRDEWYMVARGILQGIARRLVHDAGPKAIVGCKLNKRGGDEWMTAARAEVIFEHSLSKLLQSEKQISSAGQDGKEEAEK